MSQMLGFLPSLSTEPSICKKIDLEQACLAIKDLLVISTSLALNSWRRIQVLAAEHSSGFLVLVESSQLYLETKGELVMIWQNSYLVGSRSCSKSEGCISRQLILRAKKVAHLHVNKAWYLFCHKSLCPKIAKVWPCLLCDSADFRVLLFWV